jgi:hypothetical protein
MHFPIWSMACIIFFLFFLFFIPSSRSMSFLRSSSSSTRYLSCLLLLVLLLYVSCVWGNKIKLKKLEKILMKRVINAKQFLTVKIFVHMNFWSFSIIIFPLHVRRCIAMVIYWRRFSSTRQQTTSTVQRGERRWQLT